MKNATTVLAALAIGAAAIGLGIAPPAAADDCQTVGETIVCGQGDIRDQDQSPDTLSNPVPGDGCRQTWYRTSTYENCDIGG